jgi:phage shock protein E
MSNRGRNIFIALMLIALVVLLGFLYYNMSSALAMRPEEAKAKLNKGEFDAVVDVRTDAEWSMGHFPLAIHIPIAKITSEVEKRIPDKNARVLVYCNTSTRSRQGAEAMQALGYKNVRYLLGTHKNIM